MTKKEYIPIILATLMLLLGSAYDYIITDYLYMSMPTLGMIFERFLLFPIEWIILFTMVLLYKSNNNKKFLLFAILASLYAVYDLLQYWLSYSSAMHVLVTIGMSIILLGCTLFLVNRLPASWIHEHLNFFIFYVAVLLTAIFITTIIKIGWGRIRYRDMEQISQFCVWYRPCAMYGNSSFPSGHTTAFTTLLCFLQWKHNPYEKPSIYRYILLTFFILLMPVTRMIMGAHFLSDTAMGFLITYSCYLCFRNYFRKRGML